MMIRYATVLLGLCLLPSAAIANTARFTVQGQVTNTLTNSVATVNAIVQFDTFDNHTVVVSITNSILGYSKDLQAVSAIGFEVNTTTSCADCITSQSGIVRTLTKAGTFTDGANFSGASLTLWNVSSTSGAGTTAITMSALTSGNDYTIIGGCQASYPTTNCYPALGNGIIAHNPYLATPNGQAVIFTLAMSNVTSATTVSLSNMRFYFGTDMNAFLPGVPESSTPEPISAFTSGIGLLAIGVQRARRKRQ